MVAHRAWSLESWVTDALRETTGASAAEPAMGGAEVAKAKALEDATQTVQI